MKWVSIWRRDYRSFVNLYFVADSVLITLMINTEIDVYKDLELFMFMLRGTVVSPFDLRALVRSSQSVRLLPLELIFFMKRQYIF